MYMDEGDGFWLSKAGWCRSEIRRYDIGILMNLSAQLETEDCQDDIKKKNSHILKDWMRKA